MKGVIFHEGGLSKEVICTIYIYIYYMYTALCTVIQMLCMTTHLRISLKIRLALHVDL